MTQTQLLDEEEPLRRSEGRVQPYEQWKKDEGLASYRGFWIENLYDLELAPWESRGGLLDDHRCRVVRAVIDDDDLAVQLCAAHVTFDLGERVGQPRLLVIGGDHQGQHRSHTGTGLSNS